MPVKFTGFTLKDTNFHNKPIQDITWNIDGSHLGTTSSDKTCKIFSLEPSGTLKTLHTIPFVSGVPTQVKW